MGLALGVGRVSYLVVLSTPVLDSVIMCGYLRAGGCLSSSSDCQMELVTTLLPVISVPIHLLTLVPLLFSVTSHIP